MGKDTKGVELDLAQRVYQLEAIQDISLEINSTHDAETIVKVILQSILGTLGAISGAILLYDENTSKLGVHTSRGLKGEGPDFDLSKDIIDRLIETNLPFVLKELEDDIVKRFIETNSSKIPTQVWVPLIAKERLLGVISLGSKLGGRSYTSADVSFLTTISAQAAQALENARSYQLIANARRELDKRLYEQSTLYEVSKNLIATLDLDTQLHQILLMSIGIIGTKTGAIMLFDKDNSELITKNSKGLGEGDGEKVDLAVNEEFVEWLLNESGRPFLLSETKDYPQLRDFLAKNEKEISSLNPTLFVPLAAKGGLVGMMTLGEKLLRGDYNEDDVNLLGSIARQTSVAIENAKLYEDVVEAHLETIRCLSVAAEHKDEDTGAHIHRMSRYSAFLAKKINLPENEVALIHKASPMHDVGKIGIPESILFKPAKLDEEEWKVMRQHTEMGRNILSNSSSELLRAGEVIALSHHERWDGAGYPNGLAGEDIHIWGRICAIADVFDALTSERPYKEGFSNEKALGIMIEDRGTHFDPALLDLFIENIDEVVEIQKKYR